MVHLLLATRHLQDRELDSLVSRYQAACAAAAHGEDLQHRIADVFSVRTDLVPLRGRDAYRFSPSSCKWISKPQQRERTRWSADVVLVRSTAHLSVSSLSVVAVPTVRALRRQRGHETPRLTFRHYSPHQHPVDGSRLHSRYRESPLFSSPFRGRHQRTAR